MANIGMTTRQWRTETHRNFAAFCDFTLKWLSDGMVRVIPGDGVEAYMDAIQNYRDWDRLLYKAPRGTGKTTFRCMSEVWMNWRYPWLQILDVSATSDVTRDCYELCLRICREHPLLEALRPNGIINGQRLEFDTPGRAAKGRTFRFRSAGTRITGGRAHFIGIDDLETKDTVSSPTQREKMRLTLAETTNLFYIGSTFQKRQLVGTPWDFDTILNDDAADLVIEIPAVVYQDDGTRVYPFAALDEKALTRKREELRNPWLFRSQYLLDTSRDEEEMPIKREQLDASFVEMKDWHNLHSRTLVVDPAGGASDAQDRRNMRAGYKRGDGLTAVCVGIRDDQLHILDVFTDFTTSQKFLDVLVKMARGWKVDRCVVESNFTGWPDMVRNRFMDDDVWVTVDNHPTRKDKLDKIIGNLVPMFSTYSIKINERLKGLAVISDEVESQFLNLRFHSLPKYDDVIDCCAIAVEEMSKWLAPFKDGPPVRESVQEMMARGVPKSVARMEVAKEFDTDFGVSLRR